jgi:ankyrin repeat protein
VPLHSAAYKGSIDFCRVLMDAGAELRTRNVKQETAQMVAKARGFPQLAELLAPPAVAADGGKDYAGRVQLHLAASRGEFDVLTRVLKIHPSCVDAPDLDKFRRTALHKASLKGHTECVRVLVGAGADVNLLADDRWSSLHYASKEGHTEILQILFDAGANINAQKVRILVVVAMLFERLLCRAVVCVSVFLTFPTITPTGRWVYRAAQRSVSGLHRFVPSLDHTRGRSHVPRPRWPHTQRRR